MKIKRKTLHTIVRGLVISFSVLFFVGIFYVYFGTSLFTITSYELVGVPDMYKEGITTNLNTISSQKALKFIPVNKILGYRSKAIKKSVVDTLPNTEKIILFPVGLHTLRVKVTQYVPLFKIDDTHAITKEGIIYTEFKDMSALPKISFASSTREERVEDGIRIQMVQGINTSKLSDLETLMKKINTVIFVVSRIDVDTYGDISFYDAREMSKVEIAQDGDVKRIWSDLVSAVDTEPLKSKLQKNKDALEYLDIRFGDKVFYKFTGDTATTSKFTNGQKTDIIEFHEATTTSSN